MRIAGQGEIALVIAFGVQFFERDGCLERAGGFEMVDDRQRHEHRAAPGTHLPEIHVKPFADENDFRRNGGDVIPGEKPEQREVKLGKGVHPRHAAHAQRHGARAQHARVRHGNAGQLEGEVGLDGGVYFRGTAVINVPAAVGELQGKDVVDGLALPVPVHLAVPVVIGNGVRNDGGIHHQFADPIAFGLLLAQ